MIRQLTRKEVPSGSIIGWASDIHIPIHHPAATRLMCEVFEWAGVTHFVPGGDILDLHCLSSHPKSPERILSQGTIEEEVEPGRWLLDYFATRPAYMIEGNHEDRLRRFIAKEALALHGTEAGDIATLARIPPGIEVLPCGSDLRLGNLNMSHGDGEFKKSTGGRYPAQKLLELVPDYSSIIGHLHRIAVARRTGLDKSGIKRTRAAWVMPHMSIEEQHYDYVSKHPNWQMGFGVIHVWWDGESARFSVYQVEILFDKRNRPYCELWGRFFQ